MSPTNSTYSDILNIGLPTKERLFYSKINTMKVAILFAFNFIKRIRHCAGFGIQSPTDYSFVREVIYENSPYYAYEELKQQFPQATWLDMKIAHCIFRVANYAYPHRLFFIGTPTPLIEAYLNAARKDGVITINDISCVKDNDIVITLDTHSDRWKEVLSHPHMITFDLLYFGIAINRERRFSEHHIVNFY